MNPILIPAFDVIFNEKYYHKFETQINQMRVGIHLDHSTDKSDHTVDKHYGIVYDLSKFDGLPNYYYRDIVYGKTHQKVLDKTMHHSHMELYAIRDDAFILEFFCENSGKDTAEFVKAALANTAFWGEDLNAYAGLTDTVTEWLSLIREDASAALKKVLE